MGGTSGGVLAAARNTVASSLEGVGQELSAGGMPTPGWTGKLIRPVVGLAGAGCLLQANLLSSTFAKASQPPRSFAGQLPP